MNICITNIDGNPEFVGGIKRVSSILANYWKNDHQISFMSLCTSSLRFDNIETIPQYFLPNDKVVDSTENFEYLLDFIERNRIDILLHQFCDDKPLTNLCIRVRKAAHVKLISSYHFSITYKNDIIRNSFFTKYKLGNSVFPWLKECMYFINYRLRKQRKQEKYDRELFRYAYYHSDCLVLLSESQIPVFRKVIGLETTHKKTVAINNPCILPSSCTSNKEKKILWCGRVEFGVKRVDRMMKIWKQIAAKYPDWELIIMGSGNISYFESLAKNDHIYNIRFIGFCDPTKYYEKGAILCMTSSTEGLPMVLIEAQSYGCVPLAYDSFTSLSDIIIDGKNGFKIPAFNEQVFVGKLERLINNEILREEMSMNAIESVRKFEVQNIAEKWLQLFERL